MEGLATPFEGIAQGIVNLGEHFSSVLSYINPFSENFILKDLLNWLNPVSEDFILKQLWEFLTNIISYLNPLDENFFGKKLVEFIGDLLKDLFIPKEDHFSDLYNEIDNKFGFISQLKELYDSLFPDNSPNSITSPPNWTITYEGVTVTIIDWSAFEAYRGYLHSIIIFIMWASFLIRLYKRIPGIIYGYSSL